MVKNSKLHEIRSSSSDSFLDYKIYISHLWLLGRLFQFEEEDGERKYIYIYKLYLVSFLLILKSIVFLQQKRLISILIHHLICPIAILVTNHIAAPKSFKTMKVHRELHTFFSFLNEKIRLFL